MSPLLFSVLPDLKKAMKKVKWGGVKIGGDNMYTLAYADDVVGGGRGRGNEEHDGKIRELSGRG